ncbi:hypothetical protein TWF481_000338 [Arthrobotrys musiformis]|uniref:Large ribosomal subunit protein bL34m n=1 Tax=Arthrobotrys musiformis TaxID=47236 RepID=A0AAV9WMJ5_9PEZI
MTVLTLLRRPAVSCLRSSTSILSRRTFTSLLRTPTSTLTARPSLPATSLLSHTPSLQSTIPPLQGSLTQTRGHRRKTYNPSHIVRKRRFGFLARLRSKTGRNILKRRKEKGRKMLTH